jgi:hypothetical protein
VAKKRAVKRSKKKTTCAQVAKVAAPKSPDKSKRAAPRINVVGGYEAFRNAQAKLSRERNTSGRDIDNADKDQGFLVGYADLLIADPKRRERCRTSLRLFCETYNSEPLYFDWSDDQLEVIARIEEAATLGALYAFALPRGSGKTLICRMAALWAASYAHRYYPFVIGATDEKARETLDTLRILIRFLPEYAADFPEISYPAQRLKGIANRASGQMCRGESTMIEWSADRIVLPTMPPPVNWPKHWELRKDGKVPTSGVLVSASGLTGEGIRGSLKTLTTGEMVRPDFVLLDDPQTPESARSHAQNVTRMKLVSADVLGMAGPGKSMAAVMPCTVIEPGDMVDEILDREKHPMWRGKRSSMLRSFPANMTAWDSYFEVYAKCAQLEPPDFTESNALYVSRRSILDEGAEASWPERKEDFEVSAIQSAMHLYFRDRRSFMSEYQNQPESNNPAAANALDPDLLIQRAQNVPRRDVPRSCTRLTAMIDVGGDLLWYCVTALDESFGGTVIDCGTYPDQQRAYFLKSEPRPGLADMPELANQPQSAQIYAGLTVVANRVLGATYLQEETGAAMKVERCLVDANWGVATDLVYEFCRRNTNHASILYPSHGKFIGASSNPMSTWQKRPGERAGQGWRLYPGDRGRGRHVVFDANHWKTFAAERLRTPAGGAGAVFLYHPGKGRDHRLLVDHFTAEYPVATSAKGRTVDEWKNLPGRDNDFWDAFVGTLVAASTLGLHWSAGTVAGEPPMPERTKPRTSWRAMQEAAKTKNGGGWKR